MVITAIITAATVTDMVTAIDPQLRSCSAGSLVLATIMAPSMESWGREPVARFALTSATTRMA